MESMKILHLEDIMKILGIGKDKAYALLRSPSFPATKVGRTYFVTEENFYEWINRYAGKEFKLGGGGKYGK